MSNDPTISRKVERQNVSWYPEWDRSEDNLRDNKDQDLLKSLQNNVLTLLVECRLWYSVCSKHKSTRTHTCINVTSTQKDTFVQTLDRAGLFSSGVYGHSPARMFWCSSHGYLNAPLLVFWVHKRLNSTCPGWGGRHESMDSSPSTLYVEKYCVI